MLEFIATMFVILIATMFVILMAALCFNLLIKK